MTRKACKSDPSKECVFGTCYFGAPCFAEHDAAAARYGDLVRSQIEATARRMHGVTDDDGNLLVGQRADGSPIWNDAEDPLPLRRVAHFTEDEARRKAWELAGAGYGPTGISELHHA